MTVWCTLFIFLSTIFLNPHSYTLLTTLHYWSMHNMNEALPARHLSLLTPPIFSWIPHLPPNMRNCRISTEHLIQGKPFNALSFLFMFLIICIVFLMLMMFCIVLYETRKCFRCFSPNKSWEYFSTHVLKILLMGGQIVKFRIISCIENIAYIDDCSRNRDVYH